jgi:hypothetical protein
MEAHVKRSVATWVRETRARISSPDDPMYSEHIDQVIGPMPSRQWHDAFCRALSDLYASVGPQPDAFWCGLVPHSAELRTVKRRPFRWSDRSRREPPALYAVRTPEASKWLTDRAYRREVRLPTRLRARHDLVAWYECREHSDGTWMGMLLVARRADVAAVRGGRHLFPERD